MAAYVLCISSKFDVKLLLNRARVSREASSYISRVESWTIEGLYLNSSTTDDVLKFFQVC